MSDDDELDALEGDGRVVVLRMRGHEPNGSAARDRRHRAHERGNVVGMMPHPERAADALLGSTDGAAVHSNRCVGTARCATDTSPELDSTGAPRTAAVTPIGEPTPGRRRRRASSWRDLRACADEEYDRACELLGRRPTSPRSASFGAMWSEHCGYKYSSTLLRTLPTDGPRVLQGPGENAGVVDIGDGLAVAFKIESHNHPSAVEPYQGAATGVGGIVRDIFTMGARPIALLDSLRFGPIDVTARRARNRYLFGSVVDGIAGYGNCLGVPTVGGEVVFDERYAGNPLVNAMCVGVLAHDELAARQPRAASATRCSCVGARTGRDGIHGATFASLEDPTTRAERPAVQVGNPFLEKLLMEACLELLATGAVVGMQDMGAAGLTSSSARDGRRAAGAASSIDIAQVPRARAAAMTPYEMMLSRVQERMLVVVRAGTRARRARGVCERWGSTAPVVGRVTDDGMLRVRETGGEVVAELPVALLVDDAPRTSGGRAARPARTDERSPSTAGARARATCGARAAQAAGAPRRSRRSAWVYEPVRPHGRRGDGRASGAGRGGGPLHGTDRAIAMTTDCNGRWC